MKIIVYLVFKTNLSSIKKLYKYLLTLFIKLEDILYFNLKFYIIINKI